MQTWFTSDTHWWHTNIRDYCPASRQQFPTIEAMNEEMIARWNSRVRPDDLVYHLGDFSFWNWQAGRDILARLNGIVTLVRGNHDSLTKTSRMGFHSIVNELTLAVDVGKGLPVVVYCRHAPDWDTEWLPGISLGLHGHSHERGLVRQRKDGRLLINVGVDQWDFYPVTLEEIIARVNSLDPATFWKAPDQHSEVNRGLPSHWREK